MNVRSNVTPIRSAQTRAPKPPPYDIAELQTRYPSLKYLVGEAGSRSTERAWVSAFVSRPEAFESLLGDIIKHKYSQPRRIGQRPMPREEEVNLEAIISGDYTEDAIESVLPGLAKKAGLTYQSFAAKLCVAKRTYQRLLLPQGHPDKYYPSLAMLEQVAAAVGKAPSYFVEYRTQAALVGFYKLTQERPALATKVFREYLEITRESPLAG